MTKSQLKRLIRAIVKNVLIRELQMRQSKISSEASEIDSKLTNVVKNAKKGTPEAQPPKKEPDAPDKPDFSEGK